MLSKEFLLLKNIGVKHVFGNTNRSDVDISIVIPTYKRIDLLKKNIHAILLQENISDISFEVVISSNDIDFDYNAIEMNLDPKVFHFFVNEENVGMCNNMNRCATLAKGKYVTYIQDDDVLLPDFLYTINNLIRNGKLDDIDCLIPNRFYYMPNRSNSTQFGKKAIRNMRIKDGICKVLRMGKTVPLLKKVIPFESLITTYPFYSGGPTCGMVFKKNSLLGFGGFNSFYPYGFDYDFFMRFSENFNVCLFNKYLSVYMTSDSASNKPDVQYDFFRARYDFLLENYKKYNISEELKNTIAYSTYIGYPASTQKLIDKTYSVDTVSQIRIILFNIWARIKVYYSGDYRRKPCPSNIEAWYQKL